MIDVREVAVLGGGAWGTALAVHLARIGHETTLWARDAAFAADIEQRRFNPVYLPEIRFPANVRVTADVGDALGGSDLVIAAVPSHGTREVRVADRARDDPGREVEDLGGVAVVGGQVEAAHLLAPQRLVARPPGLAQVGPGRLRCVADDRPASLGAPTAEHPPLHR